MKRAVFLDRDGTLNEDPGYINDPEKIRILSGVGEALQRLQSSGYLLVVVSNQSGISRGLITTSQLQAVHERLQVQIGENSARIDHFYLCTHHPDENCSCRKPSPELLHLAAQDLGIDLAYSYMVGDKQSDVRAGRLAGVRGSFLVRTGEGARSEKEVLKSDPGTRVFSSLNDVANWILKEDEDLNFQKAK